MNAQEIRAGLESGRLHPFPLLQHLSREDDQEGARLVTEVGPEYLSGKERLHFRSLVKELVPGVAEAEAAKARQRSEKKRGEHSGALSEGLRAKIAERKETARRLDRVGNREAGGWNLPMDAPDR